MDRAARGCGLALAFGEEEKVREIERAVRFVTIAKVTQEVQQQGSSQVDYPSIVEERNAVGTRGRVAWS